MYSITGCDALQGPDRAREHRRRRARRAAAACAVRSIRSLSGPLVRISSRRSRIVGSASSTSGRSVARRTAPGPSWPASTRPPATSRSSSVRAQVHERRVRLAQRGRQEAERPRRARRSRRRSRCVVALALPTRSARSSRRSAIAPTTRGRVDDEAPRRAASSSDQLVGQARRRRERRVEVLERLVPPLPLPAYWSAWPWIDLLQALPRLRVQRVEELVEVHGRGGAVGRDLAAVVDRRVRRSGPGVSDT